MKLIALQKLIELINRLSGRRLIFISHPFSNNPKLNREKADKVCKYWYRQGYIPISPLHLFSYMDDDSQRKTVMIICKLLILICGKMAIYGLTKGCRDELQFAKKYKVKIYKEYNDNDWYKVDYKKLMEERKGVNM